MSLLNWIDLPQLGDERGSLVVLEQNEIIPFDIKRVYYIYGTKKSTSRGFHAHKKLNQVAICISGSCRMILDDGGTREEVLLDSPTRGLLVDNMVWHEMHDFSEDCVLLVMASQHYDEADYIREYGDFVKVCDHE